MITKTAISMTITLHWEAGGKARAVTIVCDDSTPTELLPILAAGCRLPERDAGGEPISYALRHGGPQRPPLHPDRLMSAQGVREGSKLWLTSGVARSVGAGRCLLGLPDGQGELAVPPAGLTLTRAWLLRALELLAPEAYKRELELLERRQSAYRFVSNRPHCRLRGGPAGWSVVTERDDVATLLDGARLAPSAPATLLDGAQLRLGDGGPALGVVVMQG